MWSLPHPIGGRQWDVHATGAGQFWHYRLTDPTSGRAILLREQGPRRTGIYADEEAPPAPEPLPAETALDWEALDPEIHPPEAITEDADGVVVIDDPEAEAEADVTRWTIKAEWGSHDLWSLAAGQPTAVGPWQVQARAAALEFREVVRSLCWGASAAAFAPDQVYVTRIDLCADVWAPDGFELDDLDGFRGRAIRRSARLMRAYRIGINEPDDTETHESQGAFSGFTFGSSPLRLRLYDKTREIAAQSGKRWFHDLWQKAIPGATFGVTDGATAVWRAEAQIRRDAARALGIGRLSEAVARANLADAWATITRDWLCLHEVDPYRAKQRRDRLPIDPRWRAIAVAWGDGAPAYYARPIPQRDAERTARAAASTLASYAAAIAAPRAVDALAALAERPDAEYRYHEVAEDRLTEQIGAHAARHPSLARAIGRAAIAALGVDPPGWPEAVAELQRRLRKGNEVDQQFQSALARAWRKR